MDTLLRMTDSAGRPAPAREQDGPGNRSTKVDGTNTAQVSDNNGLLGQYGYSGDGLRVAKATAQAQAASSMTATG